MPVTPMRVALVTCRALPGLSDDDQVALPALAQAGIDAEPVVWNDPTVAWARYDAVIVRSAWDYYHHPAEFAAWIDRMAVEAVALWNPAAVLRANLDKRYLRALESQGVAIVPTVWLEPGDAPDIAALLAARGWAEAVVKPVISAAAHRTHRVTASSQRLVDAAVQGGAAMLQPYLAEIETAGEWSVIHVGGAYSHAVRKRPRAGDFRVQPQHGGLATREEPPHAVRAAVDRLLALVPEPLLYARVDGVESGGRFLLMEMELIEPRLFFVAAPDAAPRFAAAVAALAGARGARGAARG